MIFRDKKLPQISATGVGAMSGTSLDGLDVCLCSFSRKSNKTWKYGIIDAFTFEYPSNVREQLENAPKLTGEQLTELDYRYGRWIGTCVKKFLCNSVQKPTFIASHGHTIFHNPLKGYTLQIGKGSAIAAEVGIPCISDFRSSDVCRGGQGAPLVPVGDKLLFSHADVCLNLGGIANLSYDNEVYQRIAYDVVPCNMLLNHLAKIQGFSFDKNGSIGKTGSINKNLLNSLNSLDYYNAVSPKSLGREWFEFNIIPLLNTSSSPMADQLRTSYEHIAQQITRVTNRIEGNTLMLTGGGTHNAFLRELIGEKSNKKLIVPDVATIDFKEALIFAFLGFLYMENQEGALSTVTGANANSICGCLYH